MYYYLYLVLFGVVIVPFNYIAVDQPDTLLALRSVGIEGGVLVLLLIQYLPKIVKILGKEDNLDTVTFELSKSTATTTVRQYIIYI